jgi:bisphosphoglycerate-independent phosphoglycerate mutase (AlkP superfamily)
VGTEPGHRVAWESVTGGFSEEVFEDNLKAWSGDHDVCPDAVPGVIFTNRKIQAREPAIIDLAPTILDLFKVPIPRYMEGKVIL